jgi:hypothetical protein
MAIQAGVEPPMIRPGHTAGPRGIQSLFIYRSLQGDYTS